MDPRAAINALLAARQYLTTAGMTEQVAEILKIEQAIQARINEEIQG